jgi:DNA/RNA endonuclease YhcR with UshA esterase domain
MALLGGKQWSVGTGSVSEVGVEPKAAARRKLGGGLRDRLRIKAGDGGEELFVVNKLETEVLPKLRESVAGGP